MIRSRTIYGSSLVLNYHVQRSPRKRKYASPRVVTGSASSQSVPTLSQLDELDLAFENKSRSTERTMGDSSWWDTK